MKYEKQGSQNLKIVARRISCAGVLRVCAEWEVVEAQL